MEDDYPIRKEVLLEELRRIWETEQEKTAMKWDRTLPFGDYLVDRWEKARKLGFGEGTSIYDSSVVMGNVSVGEHTWIGPYTLLDGSGGLKIGSFCSISAGVQIYSHDSINWAVSGGKDGIERAATAIGNRCYIGPNAIVSKGVTIGEGCVIGANSLVLTDVPDNTKAVGNPCRPIGPVNKTFSPVETPGSSDEGTGDTK